MLPHHKKILYALAICTRPNGEMCRSFAVISDEAQIKDVKEVRRIVRYLARKGLAEYYKGLWTEDGEPAGAGYCITNLGYAALDQEDGR